MSSHAPDEPDLVHPEPFIWLEFRLLNPPAPEPPRSPSSPTTFPLFTSLPFEIRQKIYADALIPRTILLTCNTSETGFSSLPPINATTVDRRPSPFSNTLAPISINRTRRRPCFSSPPPPPLLHVSREARSFARRHYVPSFGYHISPLHTSTPLRLSPRVFFDFDRDALLLAGELEPCDVHGFHGPMAYFLDKDECARVRRVACHADALRPTAPSLPRINAHDFEPVLSDAVVTYGGLQLHDATRAILGRQEVDPEVVFVMLSHVLDRFSSVDTIPVPFDRSKSAGERAWEGTGPLSWEQSGRDAIQKIWDGWVLGVTATRSPLRGKRIPLVPEDELENAWDLEY